MASEAQVYASDAGADFAYKEDQKRRGPREAQVFPTYPFSPDRTSRMSEVLMASMKALPKVISKLMLRY